MWLAVLEITVHALPVAFRYRRPSYEPLSRW
jgi:hypothetical protein